MAIHDLHSSIDKQNIKGDHTSQLNINIDEGQTLSHSKMIKLASSI